MNKKILNYKSNIFLFIPISIFIFFVCFFIGGPQKSNQTNENNNVISFKSRATTSAFGTGNNKNLNLAYSEAAEFISSINWDDRSYINIIVNLTRFLKKDNTISVATIKNGNYNQSNPEIIDLLDSYNNNSNIRNKSIILKTDDWSKVDLSKLLFLKHFRNITSISFQVDKSSSDQSVLGVPFEPKKFNKLSWLSDVSNLSQIEFSFLTTPNSKFDLSFDDFDFLKDIRNLDVINFSSLRDSNAKFKIQGNLFTTNWYLLTKKGFMIIAPNDRNYISDVDANIEHIKNNASVKITKISSEPLSDPTFNDHESIEVDGKKVKAYLLKGKWYWGFADKKTIMNISYSISARRQYFSAKPVGVPAGSYSVIQRSVKPYPITENEILKELKNLPTHSFLVDDNYINSLGGKKKSLVLIDNKEYSYSIIIKSRAYINFLDSLNKIKYYVEKNGNLYYFTDQSYVDKSDYGLLSSVINSSANLKTTPPNARILDPNSNKDILNWIDNENNLKNVPIKLISGKWYWDFSSIDKSLNFKFYSVKMKFLASDLSDFLSLSNIPSDITSINFDYQSPDLLPPVSYKGTLSTKNEFISLLNSPKSIVIDGVSYGMAIRNGNWYYDAPIGDIKYQTIVNSDKFYYTSLAAMNNKINNTTSQLRKVLNYFIPPRKTIAKPEYKFGAQFLKVDDNVYNSTIRNGKIFWDIPHSILKGKNIFVDSFGNYYIDLNKMRVLPKDISEVNASEIIRTVVPDKFETIFSKKITNNQLIFSIYHKKIFIDNVEYKKEFLNSKKYLVPKDEKDNIDVENIKVFAIDFSDKDNYTIYTKKFLSKLPPNSIKTISEIKPFLVDGGVSILKKLPSIFDPIDKNDEIIIRLSSGEEKAIKVLEKEDDDGIKKLFWSDPKKIRTIKFLVVEGIKKYYLQDLFNSQKNMNGKISSIRKIEINDFKDKDVISRKIIRTEKSDSKNILIYSLSGIGVVTFLVLSLIMFRNRGRHG